MENFEFLEDLLGQNEAQVLFKEPPDMHWKTIQPNHHQLAKICLIQLTTKYFYHYAAEKRSAWTLWY
jgi:hypothetical protein